jgi:hypothetical protein
MTQCWTSTLLLALVATASSSTLLSCSGGGATEPGASGAINDGTGQVGLELKANGGVTLNSATYSITGPSGFNKSGTINLTSASSLGAIIGGLPAGTGFTIALTAMATDGSTTCAGSATFSVTAGALASVTVFVECHQPPTTGSIGVNGILNICPVVDELSASSSAVFVGGVVALTGVAHDADKSPSALSYNWTANSGTLSSGTAPNPTFTCTAPGPVTITLTPSDGDVRCADARSITVNCTATDDFSFVVVGCNRVDPTTVPAGAAPDDFPSTANVAQLNRTFAEVARLNPLPDYFFFAGDMVMGYTNDDNELRNELNGWVNVYKASPLFGTKVKLVAVPGNHETQNASKISTLAGEQAWLEIMAPYIAGSNGPAANPDAGAGADKLQTDQTKLDYSFDFKGTHFVIVDTDPVGADWTVPVNWISADVSAARSAGAKHIFAIGHKPAYGWPGAPTDSLLGKGNMPVDYYRGLRDQFWSVLESNQAEAMFAAHNHLWYKQRPNKTWQIIAGNGGSALEGTVGTGDAGVNGGPLYPAYFGFTVVNVATTGVTVTSYGRDVPSAGYWAPAPESTFPTTVRDTQDITWQ